MQDPAYLIDSIYRETADLLSKEFSNEEELKSIGFTFLLGDYEGFDIVEVICREASVLSIYENLESIFASKEIFSKEDYLKQIAETADKYARSEDWPRIETERAKAFKKYVCSV